MWGTEPGDEIGCRRRSRWTRSRNGTAEEVVKFRDILTNLRCVSSERAGIPAK